MEVKFIRMKFIIMKKRSYKMRKVILGQESYLVISADNIYIYIYINRYKQLICHDLTNLKVINCE